MRALTASEAIAPAWDHTKQLLLSPLNWRVLLKVGAVAFFAQIGGGFGFNGVNRPLRGGMPGVPSAWIAGLLIGGLLVFVVGALLFYVGSRLQFVLFEVVLRRDTRIGPMWQRYGQATWRWIGVKLLFLLALIVCLLPMIIPFTLYAIRAAKTSQHPAGNVGAMIASFLGLFLFALLLGLLFGCVYLLLADFGIPSMALEATSMGETVRRVWALWRAESGQVSLFILLRFVLGLAGGIASYLVFLIAIIVLAVPFGAVVLGVYLPLKNAAGNGHLLMITGLIVLGILFAVCALCAAMMIFSVFLVFLQAYALYFLGGRYPRLGEYLEPGPAYPFTPPPPLPGPDEEDSDDGGPSLPMNPALA